MSGASELAPCPFCGGVAEMDTQQAYRALVGGQIGTRVAVYCTSCNADMGFCREDASGEDREYLPEWVVEWWNRRTPSDELSRLSSAHSEAVEDARKHLAELSASRAEVVALREVLAKARGALERDRSQVADGLTKIKAALAGRAWLREGRGSYAYDDERYQQEFGHALDEIGAALEPLRIIAGDWTDCPTDFAEITEARTALAGEKPVGAGVEDAVRAGWNACRRSIYAVCEDVQNEAERLRTSSKSGTPSEEQHAKGYYAGACYAAKSIARGFHAMEADDDDNVTAAVAALSKSGEKP